MNRFPSIKLYRGLYYFIGKMIIFWGILAAIIAFLAQGNSVSPIFDFINEVILGNSRSYYYYEEETSFLSQLGGRLLSFGFVLMLTFFISSTFTIVAEFFTMILRMEEYLRNLSRDQQHIAEINAPDVDWDFNPIMTAGIDAGSLREYSSEFKKLSEQIRKIVNDTTATRENITPPDDRMPPSPQPSAQDEKRMNNPSITSLNVVAGPNATLHASTNGGNSRSATEGQQYVAYGITADGKFLQLKSGRGQTAWIKTSDVMFDGRVEDLPIISG